MYYKDMPTKLGIYANYAKYFKNYMEGVYTYVPHMVSLQSTMWQ